MGATNLGQVAAFIQSVSVEQIAEGQTPTVRNDGTKANAQLVFGLPTNSGAAAAASEASALESEGWAKGTQNGTAVQSGTYYHDNSKYYKEQAAQSASNAATSESNAASSASSAETNALKSEGFAVGKQNGTTQQSGTYFENNAEYFKTQAAAKALVSEGWAVGKENGTDVPSTSPYYENNAKHFKDLSEAAASAARDYAAQARAASYSVAFSGKKLMFTSVSN